MLTAMARPVASPEQIREFVGRDWARVAEADRESWRLRLREHGPGGLLRATDGQRQHMRAIDPTWPGAAARAADLEHLIRFKQRLDAASVAFTGRTRPR